MDATARVYHHICTHRARFGSVPTIREICEGMGFTSTNTPHYHLNRLEQEGKIVRKKHKGYALLGDLADSVKLAAIQDLCAFAVADRHTPYSTSRTGLALDILTILGSPSPPQPPRKATQP